MPIEVLHPMTVHFPIALLLVALLVETLALALRRPAWHRVAFWNLVLGTWAALVAMITGGLAAAATELSGESRRVLTLHTAWGAAAFGLATMVAGWHLAAGQQMSRRARWLTWGLLGVTCGVMTFAAHLGAQLVFEHGVVQVDLPDLPP